MRAGAPRSGPLRAGAAAPAPILTRRETALPRGAFEILRVPRSQPWRHPPQGALSLQGSSALVSRCPGCPAEQRGALAPLQLGLYGTKSPLFRTTLILQSPEDAECAQPQPNRCSQTFHFPSIASRLTARYAGFMAAAPPYRSLSAHRWAPGTCKRCRGAQRPRLAGAGHGISPSPRACLHHNGAGMKRLPPS